MASDDPETTVQAMRLVGVAGTGAGCGDRAWSSVLRDRSRPKPTETGIEIPTHAATSDQAFTAVSVPISPEKEHHPIGPFRTRRRTVT